jgi:hypothetical protein
MVPAAIVAAVLIAASAAFSLSYWPGLMTWDSIRQYDQALNGGMDDWHPPLMEWIWGLLSRLKPGPAPMLLLQLTLSSAGYALLAAWALRRRRPGLAVAIGACSLLPISAALMGVIVKDSLMAGALLAATGLLAWRGPRRDWPSRLGAGGLIALAAGLRFNAVPACAPLLVALFGQAARRTPARLAASALAAAAALALVMPLANHLIGAQKSGVELSLIIFDLGGITEHSGVDVFPPMGVANPVAVNDDCYIALKWDTYSPWADDICPLGFDAFRAWFAKHGGSPALFWIKAVLAHPLAYAEHRLAHWNINARFLVRPRIDRPVLDRSIDNVWGYQIRPNPLHGMVDALAVLSDDTPLGWPVVWMALALGVALVAPALPSRQVVLPLALSALLYGLAYAVLSVASELRYYLWTMIAAALAAVMAISDLAAAPRAKPAPWPPRRAWIIAGPPLAVAAICTVWRLWPGGT